MLQIDLNPQLNGNLETAVGRLFGLRPLGTKLFRNSTPSCGKLRIKKGLAAMFSIGSTLVVLPYAEAATGTQDSLAVADFRTCEPPKWPTSALRNEEEGTSTIEFVISSKGAVQSARVLTSSGSDDLDSAALTAIQLCRFTPARQHGIAVGSKLAVQYVWKFANSGDAGKGPSEPSTITAFSIPESLEKARIQLGAGEYGGAMQTASSVLKVDDSNFEANYLAATASLALNEFDDADRYVTKAAQLAPPSRRTAAVNLRKTISQQRAALEPILKRVAEEQRQNQLQKELAAEALKRQTMQNSMGGVASSSNQSILASKVPQVGRDASMNSAGVARSGDVNMEPAQSKGAGSGQKCPESLAYLAPRLPTCGNNTGLLELRQMILKIDVSFRADAAAGFSLKDLALSAAVTAKEAEDAVKGNEAVMEGVAASDTMLKERLRALRGTPPKCDALENPATMGESAYTAYVASYMTALASRAVSSIAACKARTQP